MNRSFKLSDQQKNEMIAQIQGYFIRERGEELGDLAALLLLEFFMEKLAPHFYNEGIADAHQYISGQLEDLFAIQRRV
ncbi:DUF2164 domain-containing protein [Bacillus sp. CGMCC 1.16541]|uniref:DUF2164 domain-containing protein n=1 Tax=Bacillus sp. CGMCC 1.16541 TaxID=2185143 RepID=UPI000D73DB6E|nr:DUF2164 domain-containing protein [Bacillus sp. CGMCC 1.16541]